MGSAIGGAISGIGSSISSGISGIGAYKGSKEAIKYSNRAQDASQQAYEEAKKYLTPYEEFGRTGIKGIEGLGIADGPLDREKLLSEYLGGNEYQMLNDQARYNTLASAEALGGLGSTPTSNRLAAITPTLWENYLADKTNEQQTRFNQLMGITGLGLNSANAIGNFATGNGSQMAQLLLGEGSLQAGKKALPWQTASAMNYHAAQGAANMFNGLSISGLMGGGGGGIGVGGNQ
ncbi:MAG: DNA transfer protein [Citrobacter amalonaticus]|jgi:hypothetical protein|nr:DNA transfer protein [Citrobacter amalonaticus]